MKSLQQRLSLGLALALGALLVLGGLLACPALRSLLVEEFDYALLAKARALTAPTTPSGRGLSLRFTEYVPPEFQPGPRAEYFQVWSRDGTVAAKSPSLGDAELPRPGEGTNELRFWNLKLPDGRSGRALGINLALDEEAGASGFTLVFARDTMRLQSVLRTVAGGLIGGGVVLLIAAAWLAGIATRAGLRPVAMLADEVTRIDATSLATRLSATDAPPELRSIVDQLNSLLGRLHNTFDRERRFSANVAHELLTPVAELRALAENAVRWREDREATGQFAADVLDSARQMERQVNTLLTLARSERGELAFQRESIDVSTLLEELRAQSSPRLQGRRLQLDWLVPAEVTIWSDRAACRAILQNLFDNAVEYAPVGGRISCRLERAGNGCAFTLANRNPGLKPDDLPRLFEPFWRADAARTDRAHAGLGLALAKSLAVALRFDLKATLTQREEIQFTLTIPTERAAT
ncbi:MAG: HAMP domain-containing histidine kinase [Verrucomicrobiales bacterium]|nr:HAMP domain-containing histidine kinase [Verrucomicrobiales bacterium]